MHWGVALNSSPETTRDKIIYWMWNTDSSIIFTKKVEAKKRRDVSKEVQ